MNVSNESLTPFLSLQSTVDKLIKKTNLALVVGTNSWREQFIEAITVSAGKFMCVCTSASMMQPKNLKPLREELCSCLLCLLEGNYDN